MAALPMPTIIRIKRPLDAETSETIIVSTKRSRISEDEKDENPMTNFCTAILKKLTTLKNEDSIEIEAKKALAMQPLQSQVLKEKYKKGITSTAKDLVSRKSKSEVAAIRFKLICSKRKIDEDEPVSQKMDFHMLDAFKEIEEKSLLPVASSSNQSDMDIITCNNVPLESEKVNYVYDLYYTSIPIELSSWVNNICEIQKCPALDYRDASQPDSDEDLEEDDENEEHNWRNDYPEEEDDDEGGVYLYEDEDDYLCKRMRKNKLYDSDESYDAADYDDSGDFDGDGNQVLFTSRSARSVFAKQDESDED